MKVLYEKVDRELYLEIILTEKDLEDFLKATHLSEEFLGTFIENEPLSICIRIDNDDDL